MMIDLIPLLRQNIGITPGHASITQMIKSGEGITWRDAFQDTISSVLNRKVPGLWDSPTNIIAYRKFLNSNKEVFKLVLSFLTHLDAEFMQELGLKKINFNF